MEDVHMLKLLRYLYLFLALLAGLEAAAAPVLQGTIESDGTTENNLTSTTAFTIPLGPVSFQCNKDVYFYIGSDNTAAATTANGMKWFADVEKVLVTSAKRSVIAVLPVDGTATDCKVWYLYNETLSYRGASDGAALADVVTSPTDFETLSLASNPSFENLTLSGTASTDRALTILQGRLGFAPSTTSSAEIYWDPSNGFNVRNQWNMCDGCYIVSDNYSPKRSTETSTFQGAHGITPAPQAAVDACSGPREGQLTTLTTDGRLYQCDGTTNHRLAGSLASAVTSLDFGNLTSHAEEELTIALTGAVTSDVPLCRPVGGTAFTSHININERVSAADTVALIAHNESSGDVNPAAHDFKCIITR
jgi:hypothetical protein